jgi:hypothetical protein
MKEINTQLSERRAFPHCAAAEPLGLPLAKSAAPSSNQITYSDHASCARGEAGPSYLYKLFINPLLAPYASSLTLFLMRKEKAKHVVWSWEATGAFCCFTGGIGAALLGSGLTAASWILGAQMHPWLHGLGTAFLIVTIPLLIFSGYCLDWAERKTNKPQMGDLHNASQR